MGISSAEKLKKTKCVAFTKWPILPSSSESCILRAQNKRCGFMHCVSVIQRDRVKRCFWRKETRAERRNFSPGKYENCTHSLESQEESKSEHFKNMYSVLGALCILFSPYIFEVDAGITYHYIDNNVLCIYHVTGIAQSDLTGSYLTSTVKETPLWPICR